MIKQFKKDKKYIFSIMNGDTPVYIGSTTHKGRILINNHFVLNILQNHEWTSVKIVDLDEFFKGEELEDFNEVLYLESHLIKEFKPVFNTEIQEVEVGLYRIMDLLQGLDHLMYFDEWDTLLTADDL